MSRSEQILYPPGEILNPILGKVDYEYIILWMLTNNEVCEWSDFTAEISESTLSGHLKKLKSKNFIEKPEKGKYQITPAGRERFNELTYDRKAGKRKLKYPPKLILKRRNYDHWILWMLYNNYSCKWSDFKQDPLNINQSSLSSNLNALVENGFIGRENKDYVITPLGKTEYFSILKQYDLDRQSILEQESTRIEEITEKTSIFFDVHKIEDDDLKYRYLDLVLKLNYSKVEALLKDEGDFNKILLFLSINHPNHYPDYISHKEFSLKYDIDLTTLNYYIREIVDNQIFKLKFFKLEDDQGGIYYFQKGDAIEKILNAIVEKYIRKFTYLIKFKERSSSIKHIIDIELLLDNILNDICGNLFDNNLKPSIKIFLPGYVKYLAYKIETEKKLTDREAKLEGFVWQSIFEEFQTFEPASRTVGEGEEESFYKMDHYIFMALDVFYLTKLNFINTKEFKETYNLTKIDSFGKIEKLLYKGKSLDIVHLFENSKIEFKSIESLILRDIIFTKERDFDESIKTTIEIINKFPHEYIGYLLQSITYFLMDEYEEAIDIIEEGLNQAPNLLLELQKAQILMKLRSMDESLNIINSLISDNPNSVPLLRTKIIWYLSDERHPELASENILEIIDKTINLSPNDKELIILKAIYFCSVHKNKEAKRLLVKEIGFNFAKKNPRIDTTSLLTVVYSYISRGKIDKALEYVNLGLILYPDHPISYLTKALALGYNLIHKFKLMEPNIDTFIELVEQAISLESLKYNKVKYLLLQAYILLGVKHYEEVFDTMDKAIELIPNLYILYLRKAYFLTFAKRDSEALDILDKYADKCDFLKGKFLQLKTHIFYQAGQFQEAYEITDELSRLYPDNLDFINNKAIFLAELKRKEEAIETAEYLLSLNPKLGNSYDTFGEILMTFGEYEQAIENFEQALEIEPTGWFTCSTHIKMAKCYEELEIYEKELEHYEKGRLIAEKKFPQDQEMYEEEADKYLSKIRMLIEESRTKNNAK